MPHRSAGSFGRRSTTSCERRCSTGRRRSRALRQKSHLQPEHCHSAPETLWLPRRSLAISQTDAQLLPLHSPIRRRCLGLREHSVVFLLVDVNHRDTVSSSPRNDHVQWCDGFRRQFLLLLQGLQHLSSCLHSTVSFLMRRLPLVCKLLEFGIFGLCRSHALFQLDVGLLGCFTFHVGCFGSSQLLLGFIQLFSVIHRVLVRLRCLI